jgi:hypothetical protein
MRRWMLLAGWVGCGDDREGKAGGEDTGAGVCTSVVEGFADRDGDGYGDDGAPMVGCAGDAGFATESGDCDDGYVSVHPYAGDICGDGIDQDCSGADRACGLYGVGDASVVIDCGDPWGYVDSWSNYYGTSARIDGDSVRVLQQFPGQLGAIRLRPGSYPAAVEEITTWTQSVPTSSFLWSEFVTYSGGAGDSLFTNFFGSYEDNYGIRRFDPPWTGDRTENDADATWENDTIAGLAVAADPAGVGTDRVVVYVSDATGVGGTYAVDPGAGPGSLGDVAAAYLDGAWLSPAGDVDGDGISDFSTFRGSLQDVGVILGPLADSVAAVDDLEDRRWSGPTGYAPISVGDFDGDGLADLELTLTGGTDTEVLRRAYVFAGNAASGAVEDVTLVTVSGDLCPEVYTYWGNGYPLCNEPFSAAAVGDLDADGRSEILVQGAFASETAEITDSIVVRGGSSGTLDLATDSDGVIRFEGMGPRLRQETIRPMGGFSPDFDGDGLLDLFLPYYDEATGGSAILGFRGPIE